MEDLIAIALFYSYVVNGKRELPDYTLSAFISEVEKALTKLRSEYDINEKNSRGFFASVPCYTISVRNKDGEAQTWNPNDKEVNLCSHKYANQPTLYYSFASIDLKFLGKLGWLDQDLISATLDKEVLGHLDVKREDLPCKSREEYRSGETSIYSLKESEAREKAIRYLEEDGFMNISIGRGVLTKPDDYAYKFSFTGKKEMYSLDPYGKNICEKIANLRTILDMEAYKKEVLSKTLDNGKLNLEDIYLSKTALLDKDNNTVSHDYRAVLKLTGDEDVFYNRIVASMESGTSDVTVFIDLLGDEVMNFSWQGKFGNKKFESVVEEIMPLSKSMNVSTATLDEIEQHIDNLNKKPIMKELIPNSKK